MKIYKKPLLLILLFLFIPTIAFANVAWPVLGFSLIAPPMIMISILLEFFLFKYLFKLNIKTTLYYTLVANLVSTLCGVVLIPFESVLHDPITNLGFFAIYGRGSLFYSGDTLTFMSIFVPILIGAVNALLKLLTIRVIGKQKLSVKNYFLTWCINTVTLPLTLSVSLILICSFFLCP